MPLDEREQRILDEIERQLYEDDPKLAHTVARATLGARTRRRQRIAVTGFIVGLVVMLGFFTRSPYVAGLGFVIMVASAGWVAMSFKAARGDSVGGVSLAWLDRVRQRWRRDR